MWYICLISLVSAITQLDDSNFDEITMSVQNKTHEDWFILVFGDDRQSAWLLTVWDDLQSQIGGFDVNLGTIDFNAISDLETRLKLKHSPQTLYLKAGRSYNVTVNTVEEAMLLLTDPSRISTYKNRKIKLTTSWFKRMAIIWD